MPQEESTTGTPSRRTRRRIAIAAVAILLLLALALTPPMLNVSRLRHRIAASMSQSLGRPVHLDNVTMHLLPMPGFTLQNLVVSEDPAFGNEPVIRADTVEATLRASSLWRHQVEISTVRFIDPSVNIVRNAQGRWNLEDILMQAAHANTAPTAQRKAGPAPRFPYIEATGARVNLKLGEEKMPFSLTDADFALWLPSPQQWHIRLRGTPSRTDTNASDTGEVRLEGTLGRAATLATVPLNLTASWAHAQMGEASRLFTGDDQGWRGTVEAGATLVGQLGSARLTGDVHLTDLRRADFVPANLLDVSAHCTAEANFTVVTLAQVACTVPNGGPEPILVSSPSLDLQHPQAGAASVEVQQVPLLWVLDWARLFSMRIPADLNPQGSVDGTLLRDEAGVAGWSGALKATLKSVTANGRDLNFAAKPVVLDLKADSAAISTPPAEFALQLQPVTIRLSPPSELMLTGSVDLHEYAFQLTGTATSAQLSVLGNAVLPPLGEELVQAAKLPRSAAPLPMDVACVRPFYGVQSCALVHPKLVAPRKRHRRR